MSSRDIKEIQVHQMLARLKGQSGARRKGQGDARDGWEGRLPSSPCPSPAHPFPCSFYFRFSTSQLFCFFRSLAVTRSSCCTRPLHPAFHFLSSFLTPSPHTARHPSSRIFSLPFLFPSIPTTHPLSPKSFSPPDEVPPSFHIQSLLLAPSPPQTHPLRFL